jgi:hypothetical protein
MEAPYLAPGEPGWDRYPRRNAVFIRHRCTAMLESGSEARVGLAGRSAHRRFVFASLALIWSGLKMPFCPIRKQARCRKNVE